MCLLVTQNSHSPALSDAWLKDFYASNPDGVGVMYAENGSLIVEKVLPKSENCFISFYRNHIEGKDCAFHLRMRTHGDINTENCHPYQVLNFKEHGMDLWLMHNGILHTGNASDTTKSDTWHYIRDYLRPMLESNPEYAFHPTFSEIVGNHIGKSNKFVLMDNQGRTITINEQSGLYWSGLWLSNDYAWSASDSASKSPITNTNTILEQSKEQPEKRISSMYRDYSYGNNWNYSPAFDDDLELLCGDVENVLNEMEIAGLEQASNITMQSCLDFIEHFGSEAFYDIAYMCIDKDITEEWFLRCLNNYLDAVEAFPWLSKEAQKQKEGAYHYA